MCNEAENILKGKTYALLKLCIPSTHNQNLPLPDFNKEMISNSINQDHVNITFRSPKP